jgi:4-amino-4-deoxy-L-arabinose transferase-like glycosyltransferase
MISASCPTGATGSPNIYIAPQTEKQKGKAGIVSLNKNWKIFQAKKHRLLSVMYPRLCFGLIFAAAALILLGHVGALPLWGSEDRWAMISRHMFRTGELFRPFLGDSVYWDKPLLSYWAILPFAYISGVVNEAVIRLPSVFAALLLLAMTFDLSHRWFDKQTAYWAMVVLATSYGFVFWARNAQVEMLNAFFILLSIWYFIKNKTNNNPTWIYIFGCIMAVGAGFKGLPAYGAPLFAAALLIIYKRQWPQAMNWRHIIGALTLSLTAYIGFQLIICSVAGTWAPLELIWKENVVRFFQPFDHKGPIWTYFVRIFDLAAPWSLLLPGALIYLLPKLRSRESDTNESVIFFIGIFIFFTLSGSRRSYYLLPILPFFAILTGRFMADFINNRLTRIFDLYIKVFGILLSIALAAPIIILFINPEILPYEMSAVGHGLRVTATAIALISPVLAMGILSKKAKVLAGAMMAVWLIYSLAAIPLFSRMPNIRSQVAHVRSLGRPIGFLPRTSDRILFYLDQPCPVFSDQDAAFDWATRSNGVLFVRDSYKNKLPVAKWTSLEQLRKYVVVSPALPMKK